MTPSHPPHHTPTPPPPPASTGSVRGWFWGPREVDHEQPFEFWTKLGKAIVTVA